LLTLPLKEEKGFSHNFLSPSLEERGTIISSPPKGERIKVRGKLPQFG